MAIATPPKAALLNVSNGAAFSVTVSLHVPDGVPDLASTKTWKTPPGAGTYVIFGFFTPGASSSFIATCVWVLALTSRSTVSPVAGDGELVVNTYVRPPTSVS